MATETSDLTTISDRLVGQVGKLLDQLEDGDNKAEITIPQRINALIAVGRILTSLSMLRKRAANDRSAAGAGSAVRKYSSAFEANAARGRTPRGGDADAAEALDLGADDQDGDGDEYAN